MATIGEKRKISIEIWNSLRYNYSVNLILSD